MSSLKNMFKTTYLHLVALYLRRSPLTIGRWRLLNRFLPYLRNIGSTLGTTIVRTRHGFLMQVDRNDWLGQYVWLTGSYEPPTAEIVKALLSPGDTFIDVGANIGFFSLLAADIIGSNGKVYAFEPVPNTYKQLLYNIQLNNSSNTTAYNLAASNASAKVSLYEGPENHKGTSSLRPVNNCEKSITVQTEPLDAIIAPNVDIKVVKIDVEGAEQLAIEGMWGHIVRDMPALIIEITDNYLRGFGHSADSLTKKLRSVGYSMYQIAEDGLHLIPETGYSWRNQFNALFIREEDLPNTIIECGGTQRLNVSR